MKNDYCSSSKSYQVEKIINCKYFHNKKFYLIKWLCYPINQSTWEPKSNLKNIKDLIDDFESKYPYAIDKDMYNIFCEELKKNKKLKNNKLFKLNSDSNKKMLNKKRKEESFNEKDFQDPYFDKLRSHLYILDNKEAFNKKIKPKNDLIIDQTGNKLIINLNETLEEEEKKLNEEKKPENIGLIQPILL